MEGNILTANEYRYSRYFVQPFKIVFYLSMVLFVMINGAGLLFGGWERYSKEFVLAYFNEFNLASGETWALCIVFILPLVLLLINILLPKPTGRLRKSIRAGGKIIFYTSRDYKEYYKTGTQTTYYYNFIPIATYDNIRTERHTEVKNTIVTVKAVKRNEFEIDSNNSVKFKSLYWPNIQFKDKNRLYHINKMEIIAE